MSIRRSGSSSGGRPRPPSIAVIAAVLGLIVASCAGSDGEPDGGLDDATPASITGSSSTDSASTGSSSTDSSATGSSTTSASPGQADDDAPVADDVEPFPVEPVAWQTCGDLQCGTVTVPSDHDDPTAGTIEISLVRVEARGDAVGTMFVNPGGPGSSGVGFVRGGFRLDDATMSSHHLVGFDPRGIGGSAPLECGIDRVTGPLADLSPDSPDEARALDDESKAAAEQCLAVAGDRLDLVGTDSVVADLELLRMAVGDERLNYIGFSYGTLLGLRYAERHPSTVGRMVLDGLVDPSVGLPDLLAQQAEAFELAFDRLDDRCDDGLDCPDGGIAAAFERIRIDLEQNGARGEVGIAEFELATLIAMYSPALIPSYLIALAEAERGDFIAVEGLYGVLANGADYGAYAAVSCYDSPHPAGTAAWDAFADDLAATAPRFGAALANEIRACAHWPQGDGPAPAPVTAPGAPTILVIGTTGDPATPVENARMVAETLESAALVVYDGEGHTAYVSSQCVRDAVARHVADGLPAETSLTC